MAVEGYTMCGGKSKNQMKQRGGWRKGKREGERKEKWWDREKEFHKFNKESQNE